MVDKKHTILLICPTNRFYMPYVDQYINLLNEQEIKYDLLNWDRYQSEEKSDLTYRDHKNANSRNLYDYIKFYLFSLKKIKKTEYRGIIVFGIQLVFFFRMYLVKFYSNKYVIDIRDRHGIIKYFRMDKLIKNSYCTVISSNAYKEWLPQSNKYIVNHNMILKDINEIDELRPFTSEKEFCISTIGCFRDYQINRDFIDSVANSKAITLNYCGDSTISDSLKAHILDNKYENIHFSGRYSREDETALYRKSDFINVLRLNESINNKTALPNRLYLAPIFGKPLIAYSGNYLAKVIEDYKLGIVIDDVSGIESTLLEYIRDFDLETYDFNRRRFISDAIKENSHFIDVISSFCNEKARR